MQQRHDNPVSAIWTAIRENLGRKNAKNLIPGVKPSDRLDGRTVMVTGSNSGLGKAVAVDLASRGARVIMPCRGGIPEAGQEVRARSGNPQVEMISVDLSDLASVHKLCDTLRDRGERIDILVSNAGVVPKEGRKSAQGFELMVAVNCLAPTVLVDRLLRDGVIPNDTHANNGPAAGQPRSRIVFVSSEAHRTATALDLPGLARFEDFGIRDAMRYYGRSKLCLSTYAVELARRLKKADGTPDVAVHHLCPGPVDTNMARDAPNWAKPLLKAVMGVAFNSPEVAAEPVTYLAVAKGIEGRTGMYLHMRAEKPCSELALEPAAGKALWDATREMGARV
jgi:NAD(P)-dependent dehydrogenase (short-subunit alcohol dehydrogenase family)